MADGRITARDLEWWLAFAATRDWTFAKTYAATAPHHYVVEGRTPGVAHEDMVRAARVICTFGRPGKYYSVTKIYLDSPDGRFRWWTEDRSFVDTTLVNRGTTAALYGIQNAPSTASGISTPYDEVATFWDEQHQATDGESAHVGQLLANVRGTFPPHVLDVGCGTGRVLDLGLVSPDRYAGLDSSGAMLNVLVRKHPNVAAVYPTDIGQALEAGVFTAGQFDWVFIDSAVDLNTSQRSKVEQMARRAVITVDHGGLEVRSVVETSEDRSES